MFYQLLDLFYPFLNYTWLLACIRAYLLLGATGYLFTLRLIVFVSEAELGKEIFLEDIKSHPVRCAILT